MISGCSDKNVHASGLPDNLLFDHYRKFLSRAATMNLIALPQNAAVKNTSANWSRVCQERKSSHSGASAQRKCGRAKWRDGQKPSNQRSALALRSNPPISPDFPAPRRRRPIRLDKQIDAAAALDLADLKSFFAEEAVYR